MLITKIAAMMYGMNMINGVLGQEPSVVKKKHIIQSTGFGVVAFQLHFYGLKWPNLLNGLIRMVGNVHAEGLAPINANTYANRMMTNFDS